MAKSARSSKLKSNNQRLKKDVFGPVEAARAERISAKLQELISQPKPSEAKKEVEMQDVEQNGETAAVAEKTSAEMDDDTMEIDSGAASKSKTKRRKGPLAAIGRKGIEKRKAKKASIVFPTRKRKQVAPKKKT